MRWDLEPSGRGPHRLLCNSKQAISSVCLQFFITEITIFTL